MKRKLDPVYERERKDSLYSLGFTYYKEYLGSGLWRKIRSRVLERDENKCKFCGEKANVVHHTSYDLDSMSGKNLTHLHSCCNQCHKKGHKKKTDLVPKKCGRCPKCQESRLTAEEKTINRLSSKNNQIVCGRCRKMTKRRYKQDQSTEKVFVNDCSIEEYLALPQGYRNC